LVDGCVLIVLSIAVAYTQVPAGKNKHASGSWKQQGGAKASGGRSENPFDTIWTRRKFDVLGKKQKGGDAKRVGLARSAGVDKV